MKNKMQSSSEVVLESVGTFSTEDLDLKIANHPTAEETLINSVLRKLHLPFQKKKKSCTYKHSRDLIIELKSQ